MKTTLQVAFIMLHHDKDVQEAWGVDVGDVEASGQVAKYPGVVDPEHSNDSNCFSKILSD